MEHEELIIAILAVVAAIIGLIAKLISKKDGRNIKQTQKSGRDSINIQANGDVHVGNAKWMGKNKK
ncbi:hypothetical protein [Fibrobacter sp.]|uniref:hypothetical protein n=1 Tax=Fibrobacter sp. TaxID=35828 RepID=UPI00386FF872